MPIILAIHEGALHINYGLHIYSAAYTQSRLAAHKLPRLHMNFNPNPKATRKGRVQIPSPAPQDYFERANKFGKKKVHASTKLPMQCILVTASSAAECDFCTAFFA
jgi:hypothetical protein